MRLMVRKRSPPAGPSGANPALAGSPVGSKVRCLPLAPSRTWTPPGVSTTTSGAPTPSRFQMPSTARAPTRGPCQSVEPSGRVAVARPPEMATTSGRPSPSTSPTAAWPWPSNPPMARVHATWGEVMAPLPSAREVRWKSWAKVGQVPPCGPRPASSAAPDSAPTVPPSSGQPASWGALVSTATDVPHPGIAEMSAKMQNAVRIDPSEPRPRSDGSPLAIVLPWESVVSRPGSLGAPTPDSRIP